MIHAKLRIDDFNNRGCFNFDSKKTCLKMKQALRILNLMKDYFTIIFSLVFFAPFWMVMMYIPEESVCEI